MKSILITGANGQLGNELQVVSKSFDFNYIFTDVDSLDITSKDALQIFFKNNSVDYIINAAAYTAVDKAESEPQLAELINATAVGNLVELAKQYNCKLIHTSTDYVFDGTASEPYKEDNPVSPSSAYGHSKLNGELAVINGGIEYLNIRTSWLYSSFGNNFVKTMLRLGKERESLSVVSDQTGTPCYAYDLALAIMIIIDKVETGKAKFVSGIYNYSNQGVCTWYDFAKEIFDVAQLQCKVLPITTKDYPTPAKRPQYSVLDKTKIKETYQINIPDWKISLKNCMEKLK